MPTKFYNLDVDTTLGGNSPSDTAVSSQKAIKTYVDNHSGSGSVAIDNTTITKNASDQIQAIAVIDQNSGIIKPWSGTGEEYEDISEIDPDTLYITDDLGLPATEIGQITEALNDKVDKGHQVIEFQEPTSANDYTWYRKYADGWVEQGGIKTIPSRTNSGGSSTSVTFPIPMSDTNYTGQISYQSGGSYYANCTLTFTNRQTTGVNLEFYMTVSGTTAAFLVGWQVSGMAA